MQDVFENIAASMAEDSDVVQELQQLVAGVEEQTARVQSALSTVHEFVPNQKRYNELVATTTSQEYRKPLIDALERLRAKVETLPYYRYQGIWAKCIQDMVFIVVLEGFLTTGKLETPARVAELAHFPLQNSDYLHGVVSLVNELSRLAINAVVETAKSGSNEGYYLPLQLANFVKEVQSGFMLLNLKNDSLRRRYDSIKYDSKKLEEIVYDLVIRGLVTPSQSTICT